MKSHPRCRPGRTATGTRARQWRNGRWCPDNGEPAAAFIGLAADETDGQQATIWIADCSCEVFHMCPLAKALEYAADEYTGASVVRKRPARSRR